MRQIRFGHNVRVTHTQETDALGVAERRSRNRRCWRWATGIMVALALFAEVFQPGLAWLLFGGPHKNPITTTHFEVFIPRDWDVLGTGDHVSAAKRERCLTRFCTTSPENLALVTISWSGTFSQADETPVDKGWDNIKTAMLRNLQEDGVSTETRNLSGGALGPVQCVESKGPTPATAVTRFCFARRAAMFIDFHGNPGHLPAFDRMLNSIKTR